MDLEQTNQPALARIRLFMAVSYRSACGHTGADSIHYRERLEELATFFDGHGASVYFAPRDEMWGLRRPKQKTALRRDMRALSEATAFILDLGGFDSDGALVELGAALALRKPVWIIEEAGNPLPSYVVGVCLAGFARRLRIGNNRGAVVRAASRIWRQLPRYPTGSTDASA